MRAELVIIRQVCRGNVTSGGNDSQVSNVPHMWRAGARQPDLTPALASVRVTFHEQQQAVALPLQ
jgi:hypothetical protein